MTSCWTWETEGPWPVVGRTWAEVGRGRGARRRRRWSDLGWRWETEGAWPVVGRRRSAQRQQQEVVLGVELGDRIHGRLLGGRENGEWRREERGERGEEVHGQLFNGLGVELGDRMSMAGCWSRAQCSAAAAEQRRRICGEIQGPRRSCCWSDMGWSWETESRTGCWLRAQCSAAASWSRAGGRRRRGDCKSMVVGRTWGGVG